MNHERARRYIEGHEGRRYAVYRDSLGIWTVGIGFNLERASARARIEALGVDYDALLNGRCTLTDVQIGRLHREDYEDAVEDAIAVVPDFWDQPEDVQLAMVDMLFNLGRTRFLTFVNLIQALREKNYMKAADAIRDSKYAQIDVPNRAANNIALVRGCAT